MNASKENACKAWQLFHMLAAAALETNNSAANFIEEFLFAAERKLPDKATFEQVINCLWEAENGYVGCSNVRVYVWAPDPLTAAVMAAGAFNTERNSFGHATYRTIPWWDSHLSLKCLFRADAEPFVTKPDSEGWSR